MAVLIFFIHHIATSIQLPQVIASIAGTSRARSSSSRTPPAPARSGPSVVRAPEADERGRRRSSPPRQRIPAVHPARDADRAGGREGRGDPPSAPRPGHFVVEGIHSRQSGRRERLKPSSRALRRAHITGPNRTLAQDLAFAVDQLVEIAIRALSPAVNDTFTALTCSTGSATAWQGHDAVEPAASSRRPRLVRVITAACQLPRLVERAFEKIRQASRGMPAVMIRQLDALTKIIEHRPPGSNANFCSTRPR